MSEERKAVQRPWIAGVITKKTSTAGVSLEPNEAGRAAEADCEGLAGRVWASPRRCHNIICLSS